MITDAVGHIRDVQSALVYGASLGLDLREIPDNPMPDLQRAPRTQAATRPPARPPAARRRTHVPTHTYYQSCHVPTHGRPQVIWQSNLSASAVLAVMLAVALAATLVVTLVVTQVVTLTVTLAVPGGDGARG